MRTRPLWITVGALYLLIQSLGGVLWWGLLLVEPGSRGHFRPSAAPDAVLLAFILPDLLLFVGAALWATRNLLRSPKTALVPLAIHCGAAAYAALYCVMQWVLTGEAFLAALLMVPCPLFVFWLLWKLTRA